MNMRWRDIFLGYKWLNQRIMISYISNMAHKYQRIRWSLILVQLIQINLIQFRKHEIFNWRGLLLFNLSIGNITLACGVQNFFLCVNHMRQSFFTLSENTEYKLANFCNCLFLCICCATKSTIHTICFRLFLQVCTSLHMLSLIGMNYWKECLKILIKHSENAI